MASTQQNFANHVRIRPAFHYFVVPVLAINLLIALWQLVEVPALDTAWGLVLAAGLLMLAFMSRVQALSVQDRVIRLEMRLRLRQLLPADLQDRVYELTPAQLVAMRFASDAELPALTREVLAGNLPTAKAIKMRVQNWQTDLLRV
jgi:hypothetical protein